MHIGFHSSYWCHHGSRNSARCAGFIGGPLTRFYRLSAVSPKVIGCLAFVSLLPFSSPHLPWPLAQRSLPRAGERLGSTGVRPEEMVIHSGAATTEGDMSYLEEDFDPVTRNDPYRNGSRRTAPGVVDSSVEFSQLNTINFNNVDQRTAQVAVVQQGMDPTLAGQMMVAQQQALQSEANALHTVVMERKRESLVSEARDHLTRIEQTAAEEISQKNLLLNEPAAQAMSEQKSAQLYVQAQDHRIKELTAELGQLRTAAGLMNSTVDKSNADLSVARSELAEYWNQLDAVNQQSLDMRKTAEAQRKDFQREIEKHRQEQKDLIRSLKSQPLEGTPGLQIHFGPGREVPQSSQPQGPIIVDLEAKQKKPDHTPDADDEHFMKGPFMPPGLTAWRWPSWWWWRRWWWLAKSKGEERQEEEQKAESRTIQTPTSSGPILISSFLVAYHIKFGFWEFLCA